MESDTILPPPCTLNLSGLRIYYVLAISTLFLSEPLEEGFHNWNDCLLKT